MVHPAASRLPRHRRPRTRRPTFIRRHQRNGVIVGTPTGGKCGVGAVLNGDDGAQYTYCHGQSGTQTVTIGDRVTAGQHLLGSASTGNSTGPHLHFSVETGGAKRCPQTFLVSIAEGQPLAPQGRPTIGCIS